MEVTLNEDYKSGPLILGFNGPPSRTTGEEHVIQLLEN